MNGYTYTIADLGLATIGTMESDHKFGKTSGLGPLSGPDKLA